MILLRALRRILALHWWTGLDQRRFPAALVCPFASDHDPTFYYEGEYCPFCGGLPDPPGLGGPS